MKYPNTYDDDDGVDVADIGRMSVKALDNDDTEKACRSTIEYRIALVINVSVSVTHPSGIDSPTISHIFIAIVNRLLVLAFGIDDAVDVMKYAAAPPPV